jgi:hypothetical protein
VPYTGPVRILDPNGVLLAVGTAELENDPDTASWKGELTVLDGTGVARKALVVELEVDSRRSRAQLIPERVAGDNAVSNVVGLGPAPF